jgi:hypothetical protein
MKKVLGSLLTIFILFEGIAFLGASTYQPTSFGYINFSYDTMTVTDINNSTAPTIGYPVWCYNCVANGGSGTECISTGSVNSNSFILSTGTVCK